ncbi:MAG: acetyl-CoA C-acyltransferase, partial [Chloroflexota bacterium]
VADDEGIRADSTVEKLAGLKPAFTPDGSITAGNASQLSDAGAAGIVTSAGAARAAGVEPLAWIVDHAVVAGPDTSLHLKPAWAARVVLERQGLAARDIDRWEINEAFASVVLASMTDLDLDHSRVNVNGGAIALGHPLGASGFRLVLTLAMEMAATGATLGMAAICGGGGQGEAILLARP